MACTAQQSAADTCITSDAACAECPDFGEGMEGFINAVDGAFKKTQAFVMTTDPAFCGVAQDSINQEIEAKYSCCCATELTDYVQCSFDQELSISFGLVGCTYAGGGGGGGGGGDGGGDGGGIPMLYIIIGVVVGVLLLCCCFGCFCYRRRKRNNSDAKIEVNVDVKSETKTETTEAASNNSNMGGVPAAAVWSTGMDMAEKGMAPPIDDDDGSAAFFRNQPMTKSGSQKSLRDFYDEEVERSMRERSTRRGSRDYDDDDDSYRRDKVSRSRRSSRDYDDDDDSYRRDKVSRSRRSSRDDTTRSRRRSTSRKSRDSRYDSDSDRSDDASVDWSAPTRKNKKSRSKRDLYEEETTMRHARSMLKDSKNTDMDTFAQTKLTTEMAELVADLKKQKEDMESKLKTVEDEKSVMMLEMDRNQKDAEKKVANAELEAVKKEKKEMSKMIKKLEQAQMDMQGQLQNAEVETQILLEQQMDTATHVDAMMMERQELEAKLNNVEVSRDDIHMRLMEAEELSKQLKSEKKDKTKEIHSLRDAGNTSMVEASERQRRTISKSLKRVEEDKAQFRSMMAQMDTFPEAQTDLGLVDGMSLGGPPMMVQTDMPMQRPGLGPRSHSSAVLMGNQMQPQHPGFARSNSFNGLMDYDQAGNAYAYQNPGGMMMDPNQQMQMQMDPTTAMLQSLEQDMMMVQAPHNQFMDNGMMPGYDGGMGGMSNDNDLDISRRSQLTMGSRSSRRSRGSGKSRKSKSSRSRSRSKSKRSKSRDRDRSGHSRLDEKREKLRQKEKKFKDNMRRSRSNSRNSGIDCDGSYGQLSVDSFMG
ncbi:MAG: hypothetical protein SGARI_000318 [Bacillariaceae sp.]